MASLRSKDIKKLRMELGRFLHDYYVKFGEEKYDKFLTKLSPSMIKEYGEPFSGENLRIMEAEYVTFNKKLKDDTQDEEKTVEDFK